MTPNQTDVRLRHYLLGISSDEARERLEAEYFADETVVEALEFAEEDLVEAYLTGTLPGDDRRRFEQFYLSTPGHRRRVATIRALVSAGAAAATGSPGSVAANVSSSPKVVPITAGRRRWTTYISLAAAAAVVLVAGSAYLRTGTGEAPATVAQQPASPIDPAPAAPAAPAPALTLFAVALSPVQVRGSGDSAAVVVPERIGALDLRLEGDAGERPAGGWWIGIRTVGGGMVFEGAGAAADGLAGIVTRVPVPAAQLPPDDYLVSLSAVDAAGARTERMQYFLRIRAR